MATQYQNSTLIMNLVALCLLDASGAPFMPAAARQSRHLVL